MVGIISNNAALFAQRNLELASVQSESSIAKLSSGQAIIKASDDVSGLAIGTSLQTTVATLKTVLTGTGQASSLLSIADGGAKNIGDILQRQKSLAVTANSGSLSDTERAFLNEEFQSLVTQIDQIVSNTKFNQVTLLDGSIFDKSDVDTNTDSKGAAASGSITVGGTLVEGDSLTINGIEVFFTTNGGGNTVQIGGSAAASAANLQQFLSNSDIEQLKDLDFSVASAVVTVTAKQTGTIGNAVTLTEQVADAGTTVSGATLTGGTNGDLEANATIGSATVTFGSSDVIGDGIITALSTTAAARATGTFTLGDAGADTEVFTVNGVTFELGTDPGDVVIGGSAAATASNLAVAINESTNPLLENIVASDDGAAGITISYTEFGTAGNSIAVASDITGVVGANLAGGTGTGIHVNNVVNNSAFVGTISGFQATYASNDNVNVQITVGDQIYTASISDTTPAADTQVRFYSNDTGVDGGGFFDIVLASGSGLTVSNQTDANTYASRLDAAFSTVSFYQQRDVSTTTYQAAGDIYTGATQTGSLVGSSIDFKLNDYTDPKIASITVEAPETGASDGKITITLANGDTFVTASGLTDDIDDGATITLTSTSNPNETILFTAGTVNLGGSGEAIQFGNDSQAAAFQSALEGALGLGEGKGGLNFQVGTEANTVIKVALEGLSTSNIYKDSSGVTQTLKVTTAAEATTASAILDSAIEKLTSSRAVIGALQSRFNFASASITSSIQNTEAARSEFLDVNVAEESTTFATAQVRLQASISVLAQANLLPQNLLKLIG